MPSALCRAVLFALSLFLLAGCGGAKDDGPCNGRNDCADFAAIMVECAPPDNNKTYDEWLSDCSGMPEYMQHAYCVCYDLVNQGPGCGSDNWTIDEQQIVHQCWCDETGMEEACACAEHPEDEGCH